MIPFKEIEQDLTGQYQMNAMDAITILGQQVQLVQTQGP